MGHEWDKIGGDAGFTRPGLGERHTEWPSFGGDPFRGANPTCATCGGRARGANRCVCENPGLAGEGSRPVHGSGRTAHTDAHQPTLEPRDNSVQHRAGVRQPAYLLRCATCGGNSSGEWNRCMCELPDFRSRSDLGGAMQEWHHAWAREVFRVLKPGGHLVAMGGTRTYHRLVCAIEDAGFEIRDTLTFMYGQGFPKSKDVSKALARAGASGEVRLRGMAGVRRSSPLRR